MFVLVAVCLLFRITCGLYCCYFGVVVCLGYDACNALAVSCLGLVFGFFYFVCCRLRVVGLVLLVVIAYVCMELCLCLFVFGVRTCLLYIYLVCDFVVGVYW